MRGKGSLALAFLDPNGGVRRAPFGNQSNMCKDSVLDWGKQESGGKVWECGIQFVKGLGRPHQ